MILDAIIALFGSLATAIAELALFAAVPIFNILAAAIEAVVGIFVSGFTLRRIERKKAAPSRFQFAGLAVVILLISAIFVYPKIMTRELTLVAEDGHSLPFAAVVVHRSRGDNHVRTDSAGNFTIPRFSTRSVTVKDPRYVERTWAKANLSDSLMVQRTLLGSSLDSFADRLLKPKQ